MKDKYIPIAFLAFVILFMLLDFMFVYLAGATYTGVYTENYYQKGIDFDKINRQSVYNDKTGWLGEISYKDGYIAFTLRDNTGNLIKVEQVIAKVMRPTTHEFDQITKLDEVGIGKYQVRHEFDELGQWDIRVKARSGKDEYVTSRRIIVMEPIDADN